MITIEEKRNGYVWDNRLVVDCISDGFEPLRIEAVSSQPLCDVASRAEALVRNWAERAIDQFNREWSRKHERPIAAEPGEMRVNRAHADAPPLTDAPVGRPERGHPFSR